MDEKLKLIATKAEELGIHAFESPATKTTDGFIALNSGEVDMVIAKSNFTKGYSIRTTLAINEVSCKLLEVISSILKSE